MKVGIFLEQFSDTEVYKDPGLIAQGLINQGFSVSIYCFRASEEAKNKLPISIITKRDAEDSNFWKERITSLIIYSWLSLRYSSMIYAAKASGLKVYLKLDSDGRLLYPLKPSYLRVFGLRFSFKAIAIHIIRLIQWNVFPILVTKKKINQMELCDGIIIETPQAKRNIITSLEFWGELSLSEKIHVIPNPILAGNACIDIKENIIVSIGRWDDKRKNADGVKSTFGLLSTNWKIVIVGHGSSILKKQISNLNKNINVDAIEKLEHSEVELLLLKSKIIFAPSFAESFNLAVAEALYNGCSLVGARLPSFEYFSQDGSCGTISSDWNTPSFVSALLTDISKWENNIYDAQEISFFWKNELSLQVITKKISTLIQSSI